MSRGVNKVILIGRLGADPEIRYSASGAGIASLRLATSESRKDKETNQPQEFTEWHQVKVFGKLVDVVKEYVKKGTQLYIEGRIKTDKYTDKEGIERYSTSIITDQLQMLGSKQENNQESISNYAEKYKNKDIGKPTDEFNDNIPF